MNLRYYISTPTEISVLVFSIMTPCSMVGGYQCVTGAYCSHIQGVQRQYNPSTSSTCLPE